MAIHGFVFKEFTKPAHERHLQALKGPSQACFSETWTNPARHIEIQY
jgi:hypothetical protein